MNVTICEIILRIITIFGTKETAFRQVLKLLLDGADLFLEPLALEEILFIDDRMRLLFNL